MPMTPYPHKTAVVTGANRGIGLEVVRQLSRRGFIVLLAARDRASGMRAASELQKSDGLVRFLYLDVAKPATIEHAVRDFADQADHLDVLVNNAAILRDEKADVLTVSSEVFVETLVTNTLGPLHVTRAFLPWLARSDAGRVVNVSSGAGALSEMQTWAPAYSVSKAALNAVTCQLAAALKSWGVAVNSVCPGWVRTDMGGPKAPRSVEEGAQGIVWLATEAPQDLTGKFLRDREIIPW